MRMSKRAGTFVTLREVIDEVGKDVFRFIMLTRRNDQALEFDFAKVTEQSKDNPVFYVQYAHARAASVMRHAVEQFAARRFVGCCLGRSAARPAVGPGGARPDSRSSRAGLGWWRVRPRRTSRTASPSISRTWRLVSYLCGIRARTRRPCAFSSRRPLADPCAPCSGAGGRDRRRLGSSRHRCRAGGGDVVMYLSSRIDRLRSPSRALRGRPRRRAAAPPSPHAGNGTGCGRHGIVRRWALVRLCPGHPTRRRECRRGTVPLIRADERPTKVRPERPGGMEIPDRDKLIYHPTRPVVEHLLPGPEKPLPRPVPPANPSPQAEHPQAAATTPASSPPPAPPATRAAANSSHVAG